jgi:hypothetical protein
MKTQLFIPDKIKVGYQKREDTYTKKLAYVIYYDQKGVLRKETSWKGWIKEDMGIDDFDNIPTEGFVLNKGVGGVRESYGWNARNEYIRVFDPRGFEFEISVANLLWLLQECTSIKGKGLVGEFVYSWEGKELVLLPVDTKEYVECKSYTKLQSGKVSTKDLEPGSIYLDSKQRNLVYLGKYDYYEHYYYYDDYRKVKINKKFIFIDIQKDDQRIIPLAGLTSLKERITTKSIDGYAELLSKYLDESEYASAFKEYKFINVTEDQLNVIDKRWGDRLYMNGIQYDIQLIKVDVYDKSKLQYLGLYEVLIEYGNNWNSYSNKYEYLTREEVLERMSKRYAVFSNGFMIEN